MPTTRTLVLTMPEDDAGGIHHAAMSLGQLLDQVARSDSQGPGYLPARAYMGPLIAFVILQDVLGLAARSNHSISTTTSTTWPRSRADIEQCSARAAAYAGPADQQHCVG